MFDQVFGVSPFGGVVLEPLIWTKHGAIKTPCGNATSE